MRYLLLCSRQKDQSSETALINWFRRHQKTGRIINYYIRAGREIVAVVDASSHHDVRDFISQCGPSALAGVQLLPLGGSGLEVVPATAACGG